VIHAPRGNGDPLPFGATVTDASGRGIGMVGQASRIYVQGVADHGTLSVKWGEGRNEQCALSFVLPSAPAGPARMVQAESVCRTGANRVSSLP
jgi:outer membrane usher protein